MRNGTSNAEAVIKIRCSAGHVVTCAPADVLVTHSHGILVGHQMWCEQCAAYDSTIAEPERIAMLLELGVELAPQPCDVVLTVVGDHRRVVSAKYFLELEVPQLNNETPPQDLLEHP